MSTCLPIPGITPGLMLCVFVNDVYLLFLDDLGKRILSIGDILLFLDALLQPHLLKPLE
jgi:hypothetical protein